MNKPEPEQIEHWLKNSRYQINRSWKLNREGFHAKNDVSLQTVYVGVALDHAALARAKFLNGDPIDEVRTQFTNAARCILKSFTMAYDESDPDYQGEKADWVEVGETIAIDGFNFALMAADFGLAKELASWYRDRPDGRKMDPEVNHYAHDVKRVLRDGRMKAWNRLKTQFEAYMAKPPKRNDFRKNYYTLTTALFGIVDSNEERFNQGLLMQLEFYQGYAQGEAKNTTEEFICDHAVALANLGIHYGLNVTVEFDTLPKGLLMQK